MFWGKRCVFNNFLKISNELADLISVGSLFHALAAVTVKVRSPALVRVLGQQIRNNFSARAKIWSKWLIQLKTIFYTYASQSKIPAIYLYKKVYIHNIHVHVFG